MHLLVSVISTDGPKVTELTEERGYSVINIMPLKEKEREDITLVRQPIRIWNLFLTFLGAVSRKPRKLFGPVKPLQNLEPCYYRAVLFTYSKDGGRFPSYKKFQAYTLLRF